MRSADLPTSYRTTRLAILVLTFAAAMALVAWSVWVGLPQAISRTMADVLRASWWVWSPLS
ncbi:MULTISPECIES: hypothetical protein [Micromonospora]|uniref:Uncharacterized protein n=1 Tax=Micromonospora vinacea TaxID=709878 RepID=A0ABS0K7U0_9ACTN|nr:hypothetical protein [Micromonospora vinacea]MBG6104640.1 hypothetical protein [Micromonospora vinacea]WSZ79129.1 hypothetical protein OH804_11795 [Micromonospora sp. NBC_00860]